MVFELEDSHVWLYPPAGNPEHFDRLLGFPANSRENVWRYIENERTNGPYEYADMAGENIGYVHIPDFEGDIDMADPYANAAFEKIDAVLREFESKEGLIIDVRSNQGGNDFLARITASRFADQQRQFSTMYWRTGPGHDDYISKRRYVEPKGPGAYARPVVVLTNRDTFSAAESFVGMMMLFPDVAIMGGVTGGGAGGTAFYELPNGLTYRVTTKFETLPDGTLYEGVGISPDILITNSDGDVANGIDGILEEAILYLTGG
jgi:C-terminal processing protease CtpA/Prc